MVAVEARHHLVGELFGVGRDIFEPEQRDLVVARCVLIVPGYEEFDGEGAGRGGLAAEALGAAAESAEAGALLPVGVQDADRNVDGDLVDFAEDEIVFVGIEGVAGGVAGGEGAGEGAAAAQFGGLRGEGGGGEEERECGEEGGWGGGGRLRVRSSGNPNRRGE